jgi:hypothetical protein
METVVVVVEAAATLCTWIFNVFEEPEPVVVVGQCLVSSLGNSSEDSPGS